MRKGEGEEEEQESLDRVLGVGGAMLVQFASVRAAVAGDMVAGWIAFEVGIVVTSGSWDGSILEDREVIVGVAGNVAVEGDREFVLRMLQGVLSGLNQQLV